MTTPFVDGPTGQEARPASATQAPVSETVQQTTPQVAAASPVPLSAPDAAAALDPDAVAPDYPPVQEDLPPAPTSPTVDTVPFDQLVAAPSTPAQVTAAQGSGVPVTATQGSAVPVTAAPVTPAPRSPIDAPAALATPAPRPTTPAGPVVPQAGQPRFSVPGLEHVVVEGTEPAPVGPVGYRTPARFAHQQAVTTATAPPAPVLAMPITLPEPRPEARTRNRTLPLPRPEADATAQDQAEPSLPSDAAATTQRTPRRTIGATPASLLGAVAGIAALGLAAWWFLAPASVHVVGVALGALALVLSVTALRNPAATWQRPVALLGAVLGGVGTLALLWAVATALLPTAGVTLPDLTGSGTVPTLAP